MSQPRSLETVLQEAKVVHGNKYDYSRITNYRDKQTKVEIVCSEHGSFWMRLVNHTCLKQGCPKCGQRRSADAGRDSLEDFVAKAQKVHGNFYDYSRTNYVNSLTPIAIICPKHGPYSTRPILHTQGRKCNKCAGRVVTDTDTFLHEAKKTHGTLYDYSKSVYVNAVTKVEITCRKHGPFFQLAKQHVYGRGCEKCGLEKMAESNRTPLEEIIRKFRVVHGDTYDYSLVEKPDNTSTPVSIICRKHGVFQQAPVCHIHQKHGCPKCANEKAAQAHTHTQQEFLERAKEAHGNTYDYSKSVYVRYDHKVEIICRKHGVFRQTPHSHAYCGQGCPKCSSSQGERLIHRCLEKHRISYETQKIFLGCVNPKTEHPLKFDVYIPSRNLCIEFDGPQHFPEGVGGYVRKHQVTREDFLLNRHRDEIKEEYTKLHNISLLRISHREIDKIEDVIETKLSILN